MVRYSDYLRMLHKYIGSEKTQADFVIFITTLFMREATTKEEKEEDEKDLYNPLNQLKQRSLERIYTGEGKRKIAKSRARVLTSKFSGEAVESELTQMDYELQGRLISDLKGFGIKARRNNIERVVSNTYYDLLSALSQGKDYIETTEKNKSTKENSNKLIKRDITIRVKEFLIKHEDELALLPLCQIADNINPLHKHHRQMYNDYLLLENDEKEKLLKKQELPVVDFKDNWLSKSLELFKGDVDDNKLRKDRDLLYEGAKYLHRALNYSENEIDCIDPYVFTIPVESPTMRKLLGAESIEATLGRYIERYLEKNIVTEEPLDLLWEKMDLGHCSQEVMCFWTMRFIISACVFMPLYKDSSEAIDETCIETMEDMYYYALYQLWSRYIEKV